MAQPTGAELRTCIRALRAFGDEESLREARRIEGSLRIREFMRRLQTQGGRAYMKVDTDALGPDAGPES